MAVPPTTLRLVATYGVDWLSVLALAVGTLMVNRIDSKARPFSLTNPNISYPFTADETVPMLLLASTTIILAIPCILVGTIVPALWYSYRGDPAARTRPQYRSGIWRKAIWELHIMILGFVISGTATLFMTESLKVMIGKPRPDCISRCQPDLTRVSEFVVGGISNQLSTGQLVSKAICTGTNHELVNDGFKSFPSGHSSSSAAGLGYLSLFLAGKFGLLSLATLWTNDVSPKSVFHASATLQALPGGSGFNEDDNKMRRSLSSSAAPHISLTVIALIPYAIAIFVSASRWHDYRHHAADILFGFAMGTIFAALSYRYAQLHLLRALGPRPVVVSEAATGVSNNARHDYDFEKEWRAVPVDEEALDGHASREATNPLTASTVYRPEIVNV